MERGGFEPPKSKDNGFTARPSWPLWYLSPKLPTRLKKPCRRHRLAHATHHPAPPQRVYLITLNCYTESRRLTAARRRNGRVTEPSARNPVRVVWLRRSRWSWRGDSNLQPADYKSAALPVELRQRKHAVYQAISPSPDHEPESMPAGLAAPAPPANLGSAPRRADGQAIPRGHAPRRSGGFPPHLGGTLQEVGGRRSNAE